MWDRAISEDGQIVGDGWDDEEPDALRERITNGDTEIGELPLGPPGV